MSSTDDVNSPQAKLKRMADHFNDIGLYTKEGYCYDLITYIDDLEEKIESLEKEKQNVL